MFAELIEDLFNGINMIYFIDINHNVIQVDNYKDFWLLGQDFIDISLKTYWDIGQAKKYHLVYKIAVPSLECCLLLVFFTNSYPIMGTSQIKLYKILNLT